MACTGTVAQCTDLPHLHVWHAPCQWISSWGVFVFFVDFYRFLPRIPAWNRPWAAMVSAAVASESLSQGSKVFLSSPCLYSSRFGDRKKVVVHNCSFFVATTFHCVHVWEIRILNSHALTLVALPARQAGPEQNWLENALCSRCHIRLICFIHQPADRGIHPTETCMIVVHEFMFLLR